VSITTTTHLNFRGDARAALEFYRSVFGGELTVLTNAQMGSAEVPAEADQVKWGQVVAPNGFRVMAYDVPASKVWAAGEIPFFLSVRGETAEEVTELWKGLSEGATLVEELAPAPWAPLYGMLTDRFGVTWVLDVVSPYAG
jgi:PhnB protein